MSGPVCLATSSGNPNPNPSPQNSSNITDSLVIFLPIIGALILGIVAFTIYQYCCKKSSRKMVQDQTMEHKQSNPTLNDIRDNNEIEDTKYDIIERPEPTITFHESTLTIPQSSLGIPLRMPDVGAARDTLWNSVNLR